MKTQKLLTLLATTVLLVPTFSNGANALEDFAQDASTQEVATTPEENTTSQEVNVEDTIATLPNPAPTPTLARAGSSLIPRAFQGQSGIWGTAPWTFTDDGLLTFEAGEFGDAFSCPWSSIGIPQIAPSEIQEIAITGPVTFSTPFGATILFQNLQNLTSITGLPNLDTSNVADMHSMFYGCSSLKTLDLSKFDTSNCDNMASMFAGCSSLAILDLSSFDISNVVDMYRMFYGCSSLKALDLSSFDASDVRVMSYMLYNCPSLRYLTLGKDTIIAEAELPEIDTTSGEFTGQWVNLDTGTVWSSSADFMRYYDGRNPGTYEWVKKYYSITYHLDGGETDAPTSYDPLVGVSSLPEATKEGYIFQGWFDEKGRQLEYIRPSTMGDLVLTARYLKAKEPRIEIKNITPTITKGKTYKWQINDHAPAYYDEYGEKIETLFYAKLNGKIYDQNDTVELAEGTYEVEITNERPLTRGAAVTTTAKITITSTDPTPDTNTNDLANKILDITKDYNLSNEAQNNIAKELEEKAKNGTLSLDDIKQIIQKYAPNLSASEQEELAGKLYKLLYPNNPLLPSTNETKQAGLTLLGVALVGLGVTVFWIRRRRKI